MIADKVVLWEAKQVALGRFATWRERRRLIFGFRYFELLCRIRVVARANLRIGSPAASAAGFDNYLLHPSAMMGRVL
jgi:hypothetical protein